MTGRIRTVKPEWLEDELLAAASDEARVLSIALILMADDYGRGRASVAAIAAGAWRYQMERDDGAHAPEILARASRALRELVEMGFVELYEVGKQRYFAIRNWSKHQKIDRPSKPRIPEPNSAESFMAENPREDVSSVSRGSQKTLATDLDQGPVPTTTDRERRPAGATSAPTERMLRSLTPVSDREDEVIALISQARQAAGGPAFKPVNYTDRDTVTRLRYWGSAQPNPDDAIRAVLAAFFAAKGTRARLSWLTEEDPARYLAAAQAQPQKRGEYRPSPPNSAFHDDFSGLERLGIKI